MCCYEGSRIYPMPSLASMRVTRLSTSMTLPVRVSNLTSKLLKRASRLLNLASTLLNRAFVEL